MGQFIGPRGIAADGSGNVYLADQNRHFNGIIDEVRFWNRALSQEEIKAGMDASVAAVQPMGKIATTWAQIESSL